MAITFQGDQNYRTDSASAVLDGAARAAVQWFLRVPEGIDPNVADHRLFSKNNKVIQVRWDENTDSGAHRIQVEWISDGGFPTLGVDVIPGQVHHLLGVFDNGTTHLYLDGVLQGTQSAGSVLTTENRVFYWGIWRPSFQGDVDSSLRIELDDFALWDGYVPTEQEIKDLRDRKITPSQTATPATWHASYNASAVGKQSGDAVALTDDAALRTDGVPALDGLVGSPTYGDDDLTFIAPVVVSKARVGLSGKTLVLFFETIEGVSANVQALNVHPTVSINGGADTQLSVAWWGGLDNASGVPYVVWLLPQTITDADTVTVSAPADFVETVGGPSGAITEFAATGPATFLPAPPATVSMPIGNNVNGPRVWQPYWWFANLVPESGTWFQSSGEFTTDADDWLETLTSGAPEFSIQEQDPDPSANYLEGAYTIDWDIKPGGDLTGTASIRDQGGNATITLDTETVGLQTGNRRTYTITRAGNASSNLRLVVDSADVTNIRVYPPNVDPDNPGTFNPSMLERARPFSVIRYMEFDHINESNQTLVSERWHTTNRTWETTHGEIKNDINIIRAEPYTNPNNFLPENGRILIKFTADSPHGLVSGQFPNGGFVSGPSGGPNGNGRLNLTSGGTVKPEGNDRWVIEVISDTEFAWAHWNQGTTDTVDGVHDITGTLRVEVERTVPLSMIADFSRETQTDPWICIPHAMADDQVQLMAEWWAANLPTGRKLRVEWSNETWNTFGQFFYAAGMAWQRGFGSGDQRTSSGRFTAVRAKEIFSIFETAFANTGRSDDLIRVVSGWANGVSYTGTVTGKANEVGTPIDEFAIAPYFDVGPTDQITSADADATDVDQLMDITELWLLYGTFQVDGGGPRWTELITDHRAQLDINGYTGTKITTYEGGMQKGMIKGTSPTDDNTDRAWAVHPRLRDIVIQFLRQLADQGCALYVDFELNSDFGIGGSKSAWSHYWSTPMKAGTGDGSDGQFVNLTDPWNTTELVSTQAQGFIEWNRILSQSENKDDNNDNKQSAKGPTKNWFPSLNSALKPTTRMGSNRRAPFRRS